MRAFLLLSVACLALCMHGASASRLVTKTLGMLERRLAVVEKENARLTAITNSLQSQNNQGSQDVVQSSVSGISFTAALNSDTKYPRFSYLKFDRVISNAGNGYDPSTGSFTCPIDGTYLFTYSITAKVEDPVNKFLHGQLLVNMAPRQPIIAATVVTKPSDTDELLRILSSNSIVLNLKKGNKVAIGMQGYKNPVDSKFSYFSGVFLHE